jgi:hypothetical protein
MRILISNLLIALSYLGYSQLSISLLAEPTLNITTLGAEPKAFVDSFNNIKSADYTLAVGFELRKQIDRYQSIAIIPGFYQTNVLTTLRDLQFLDIVHPELPEIRDLAFAASKVAEVRYRQQYIGSQFLYNKKLQIKVLNSKVALEIGGGLGTYFLVNQDAKVTTEGFSIQESSKHIIKEDIGVTSKPFLLQAIAAADVNVEILPLTSIVAGIKLAATFMLTTSSLPSMTIWTPALRFGIRREI